MPFGNRIQLVNRVIRSVNSKDRLGINRNTLYKKLKEYGLEKPNSKASPGEAEPQ